MWLTFGSAVLIAVLVLYVPGYLVGRGLRLDRFASVAVAPAFSAFALVALGVVLFAVGITCSAWMLACLCCAVPAGLRYLRGVRRAKGGTACSSPSALGDVRLQVALYVGVALFVAALVFLHAMGDPASFSRNDDTTVHLSVVRGFLDSGTYSTLNVTKYLDIGDTGGYYPAAWHVVTAVVASFVGNEVALATNVMIFVTCTVVLPLGVLCLMRALFPDKKLVVYGGSLFSAVFCGFPWGFVVYGQLLSNLFSFAMIPAAFGVLICGLVGKGGLPKSAWITAYACSMVAVALAQPNGAFTLGVGRCCSPFPICGVGKRAQAVEARPQLWFCFLWRAAPGLRCSLRRLCRALSPIPGNRRSAFLRRWFPACCSCLPRAKACSLS